MGISNRYAWHITRVFDLTYFWRSQRSKFKMSQLVCTFLFNLEGQYYSCWIGVVDLHSDRHGYQLSINHQHTSYMKLSVHCAFEEGFVGLCFVSDALTTDTQVDGEKIYGSSGFDVEFASTPWPGGYRVHIDRCITLAGALTMLCDIRIVCIVHAWVLVQ
jgi:hypothetical protein